MDVIWHHHPRQKFKPLAVMETNHLFHQRRDAGFTQKTFAEAAIQIFLQFYPLFPRSNASRSDLGDIALSSGARSIAPRGNGQEMLPLAFARGRH